MVSLSYADELIGKLVIVLRLDGFN